jgi:hypothetical protein
MNNFKDFLVLAPYALGIAILLNLFVYQGMEVVYPSIDYNDYCGSEIDKALEPDRFDPVSGQELTFSTEEIEEYKNSCEADGGRYESARISGQLGYCDENYSCNLEREAAERDRALVMLVVLIAIGTLSLIFARKSKSKGVELGLAYGGLFMLLSTLGQLWQVGSQAVQLVAILFGLGLLLYFASKRTDLN